MRSREDRRIMPARPQPALIGILTARAPLSLCLRLEQVARDRRITLSELIRRGAELVVEGDAGGDQGAAA
jgi:hypothetical protein